MGFRAQYIYILKEHVIISAQVNSAIDEDNDHVIDLLMEARSIMSRP